MNTKFDIPQDNPFLNDRFDRKKFIDNIMKVFNAYDENIVISLDSAWGTGKTTFIKMWETYIHSENSGYKDKYAPIYFNAWENDDNDDALVPLISLLTEKLEEVKGKEFKDTKLYKVGSKIIKKGVPFALKILSHGLLDLREIQLGDSNEKSLEDYSAKLGEAFLEDYRNKTKDKTDFKDALVEYQSLMKKKIIIFIDELDRCRPLYAIEVLERIKHFFDLDNFIFVLAIDKTQLSHSISTVYGEKMDSTGYLRRFIDFEFMLPEPYLRIYIDEKFKEIFATNVWNKINIEYFKDVMVKMAMVQELTLRDIDKMFIELKVLVPLLEHLKFEIDFLEAYVLSNIYAFLIVTKQKNTNLYIKIRNSKIKPSLELLNMADETLSKINLERVLIEDDIILDYNDVLKASVLLFLKICELDFEKSDFELDFDNLIGMISEDIVEQAIYRSIKDIDFHEVCFYDNRNNILENLMFVNNLNV